MRQAARRPQSQEPLPKTGEEMEPASQFQLPEGVASYYQLQRKNELTFERLQAALAGLGIQARDAKKKPAGWDELQAYHQVALAVMLGYREPKSKSGLLECLDQMRAVQLAVDEHEAASPEELARIAGVIEALMELAGRCNDQENPAEKKPEKKAEPDKTPEKPDQEGEKPAGDNHSAPGLEALGASEKKELDAGLEAIPDLSHLDVDKRRAQGVLPEQENGLDLLANLELDVKDRSQPLEQRLDAAIAALKTVASWSVHPQLSQTMNQLTRARAQLRKLAGEIAQEIEDRRRLVPRQKPPPRKDDLEKDEEELHKSEDLDQQEKQQAAQSATPKEARSELETEVKTAQVEEKKLHQEAVGNPEKKGALKDKQVERKQLQTERKEQQGERKPDQRSDDDAGARRELHFPDNSLFVAAEAEHRFYAFERDELHHMLGESGTSLLGFSLDFGLFVDWLCAGNPNLFHATAPEGAELITEVDRRKEARERILQLMRRWLEQKTL